MRTSTPLLRITIGVWPNFIEEEKDKQNGKTEAFIPIETAKENPKKNN